MSVTLWKPLRQSDALDRLVDDFFGRQTGSWDSDVQRVWRPATDLVASDDGYRFYFDIPGVSADDISIDVDDGVLTVSGERKSLVGSGDRSERIRTYNFPQGRVTDHRINLTLYKLDDVLAGNLDLLIEPLNNEYQADQLAAMEQ